MSLLLSKMLRRLQNEAGPDGDSAGGAASEPAADNAVDWAGMSDENDLGGEEGEAGVEAPNAAETDKPLAPPEEEASETPPDTTPEEAPAAEEAAVVEAPQLTPEQLAQREKDAAEWMKQREMKLQEYYALDEDSAAKMVTEPEVVLPQLAAKLHMQIETAVRSQVQTLLETQLPHLMKAVQTSEQTNQQAKDAFFKEWPDLKGYEDQVLQVGSMFRQMNPKADTKTSIESIGRTVMAMLNLTPKGKQETETPPVAKPFKPAGGGGSQVAPKGNEGGVWAELAEGDF